MSWQDDPIAEATPAWASDPIVTQSSSPKRTRSIDEELDRQVGLTKRYTVEGAAALPALFAKIPATAMNGVLDAIEHVSGKKIDYRFPDPAQHLSNFLTQAGLPNPETPTEEMVGAVSRPIAGAAAGMGFGGALANEANPIAQGVGRVMQANPLQQGLGGITGGAAAEVTRQEGGGPLAQTVAGLAGSMAVPGGASGAPALVKQTLRGGEAGRQGLENTIKTFEDAGSTPSLGQGTQGRVAQAAESFLSKFPGGAGRMAKKASSQAAEIGQGLEETAATLAPKSSGQQSGSAILKGISGENGFVDQFKAKQGQLYDKLDQHIAPSAPVKVANTEAALAKLNADIPGAEAISEFFKNAKIKGIEGALEKDTTMPGKPAVTSKIVDANGAPIVKSEATPSTQLDSLPYEAIKKLRTLVGNEMSDSWAGSDVPRSKWKALYGALSSDLEGAAQAAGPQAQQAYSRANTFTRAGMARIDQLGSVIDKNGGPEKVFQAAVAGNKEGDTIIHAVMQSLPEDAQRTLTATVVRRLGSAKSGQQNDLGDKFSTETFLTNWNTISPEAKRTLFDRYGADFRKSMDQVASVASNLRSGSKVFVNPSGTGQAVIQHAAITTFIGSLLTGHLWTATGVAGGAGAANLAARLMTNPRFVKWLAGTTKTPTAMAPAMVNALAQEGRKRGDQDLVDAAELFKQGSSQ